MIVAKTGLKKMPKTCKQCDYRAIYPVEGEDICRIAGLFCPWENNPDGVFGLGKPDWCPLMDEVKEWISVDDRLPDKEFWEHNNLYEDEDLEVLAFIKGAKMATTLFYNSEGEFYSIGADGATFYNVTHWMPLPQPPKGE